MDLIFKKYRKSRIFLIIDEGNFDDGLISNRKFCMREIISTQ